MYTYRYDETTGGIVLLDDDTVMHSNEPRPVYAREMDFIGMDRHWTYDRQMEIPYLWAEAILVQGNHHREGEGGSPV